MQAQIGGQHSYAAALELNPDLFDFKVHTLAYPLLPGFWFNFQL